MGIGYLHSVISYFYYFKNNKNIVSQSRDIKYIYTHGVIWMNIDPKSTITPIQMLQLICNNTSCFYKIIIEKY